MTIRATPVADRHSGSRRGGRIASASATFLTLAIALPLAVLSAGTAEYTSTDLVLRYAVVLYAAIRLSFLVWGSEIRPVAGVFWMFVYISMGIVPVTQLLTGATTMLAVSVGEDLVRLASGVTVLGCLCFDAAYHFRVRPRGLDPGRLTVLRSVDALRLFTLVALGAALLYVVQVGGVAVFFSSREETGRALDQLSPDSGQAVRAIISAFGSVTCLVALIFYVHLVRRRRRELILLDWLLLAALVVVNIVVNNPVSNSRYWTLAVLFGLILPLIGHRKSLFNLAILGGVFAAIFLFPLSDIYRRTAGTAGTPVVESVWEMISTKDYDQYTMLANTIGYTAEVGFAWGYQMLGALLFWIPRVIWPNKPMDSGVAVGEWMNSVNLNLSSSLWGEAWINFGVIGVVALFMGFGLVARRLDGAFRDGTLVPGAAGYLGISIFAGYMFILLRGSLLQAMGRLAILVLATLFLTTTIEHVRRHESEEP